MSDLLEMLLKRRSVRKYTGKPIPDELIEQILEVGLASETSRNTYSWEFIVVRNKETLAKMAHFRLHSALMLEGADAGTDHQDRPGQRPDQHQQQAAPQEDSLFIHHCEDSNSSLLRNP